MKKDILAIPTEELKRELLETYHKQRYGKLGNIICVVVSLFYLLLGFYAGGIGLVIGGCFLAWEFYHRLIKPKWDANFYEEQFNLLLEKIERFKLYKDGKIKLDKEIKPSKMEALEKSIQKNMNKLLVTHPIYKLCGCLPFIQLRIDEEIPYWKGALPVLQFRLRAFEKPKEDK
ncbi:MAG: hypothetical protein KGV57_03010 [Fusobacterium sp.]|nr:hypothetical protein [Fusobacterium sp.]